MYLFLFILVEGSLPEDLTIAIKGIYRYNMRANLLRYLLQNYVCCCTLHGK